MSSGREAGGHRPAVRATAAFGHRDFRLFWIGAFVSNTGNWMQRVTIPYVLWDLTESATWVGFSSFALLIPFMATGPLGGSAADRFPRRTVLIVANTAAAGIAVALWALWVSGSTSPWAYVGLVFVFGIAYGSYAPSWHALIPELVPRELLINAVTLDSAQVNLAKATGPAAAGIVIAVAGPGVAFLLNALTFCAVVLALVVIRAGRVAVSSQRARPVRDFASSLGYVRRHRGILVSLVFVLVLGLLGDPLVQFIVVFTDEVFGVGEVAFGALGAVFGLGAIAATPLVAGRGSRVRRSRMIAVSVTGFGVATTAFALAPTYAFALPAMFAAGATWLTAASSLSSSIQLQVDDVMRGKIMALWLMAFGAAKPVGGLVQGAIADQIGVRATVAGAGLVLVAVALLLVVGLRALRHVDDRIRVVVDTTS
ncbi:MAG: MFS transporter [Acidimicrobiia bacterium]|nr:MFS transporter [Acidimicrobiia bacterium]